MSVWTWRACALSSSQWWAKVSWYGCSVFLWFVGIVCPSSCPLWKLLLLQPTIRSAISGYRRSPAHTFVVSSAGLKLLEISWFAWNLKNAQKGKLSVMAQGSVTFWNHSLYFVRVRWCWEYADLRVVFHRKNCMCRTFLYSTDSLAL